MNFEKEEVIFPSNGIDDRGKELKFKDRQTIRAESSRTTST